MDTTLFSATGCARCKIVKEAGEAAALAARALGVKTHAFFIQPALPDQALGLNLLNRPLTSSTEPPAGGTWLKRMS